MPRIATLAAQAMINRDIAQPLFVTTKTEPSVIVTVLGAAAAWHGQPLEERLPSSELPDIPARSE